MSHHSSVTRRHFFTRGSLAAAATLWTARLVQSQTSTPLKPLASPAAGDGVPDFPEHDPQIDRARVKHFVIAGHTSLPVVMKMLADDPTLINGAIDWGNGDFETALGGASHMGRPDIAEFLLAHNARLDIFAATMLGKLDIVKAAVDAFPGIVHVPGPHRIPLIAHAEKGGERAVAVLKFLRPLVS
jgi:hypothetical protein